MFKNLEQICGEKYKREKVPVLLFICLFICLFILTRDLSM